MATKGAKATRRGGGCTPPANGTSGSKIRRSKASLWRTAVLIGVHLLIAIHVAHWWSGARTLSPLEPSEAMEFSKAGIVNAGLVFFAVMIVGTLVFGRFFCGWGCHLVALQDLCRWLLLRLRIRPIAFRSRMLSLVPLFAFVYMFLWPLGERIVRGDPASVHAVHLTTASFWRTFPSWIVATLTFLVCGFAIVYFLGAKGFCTYACPYGAAFAIADRTAPGRIRVTDACAGCAHCSAVCTSNVRVHEEVRDHGMVVDPGCMKCLDCVSVCPKRALYYGFGRPSGWRRSAAASATAGKPTRSEEVLLAGVFLAGFFAFRGLYGAVPFLFALGIGAILAYLVLQLARLTYRPNVSLLAWPLRRGGRLTRGGVVFVGLLAAVVAFTAHSGWVRALDRSASAAYAETTRLGPFDVGGLAEAPSLVDRDARVAEKALERSEAVGRWSLMRDVGNELRRMWLLGMLGRFDEADDALSRAVRSTIGGPKLRATVRFEVGKYELARGRFDRALDAFRDATRIDPEASTAWVNIGEILVRTGRLEPARSAYEEAIAITPHAPEPRFHLGVLEAVAGRMDAAIARFAEAVELRPAYPEALHNLTGSLLQSGRVQEAVSFGERAVAAAPDDPGTHHLLALAYEAAGELTRARRSSGRAVQLAPESVEYRITHERIGEALRLR